MIEKLETVVKTFHQLPERISKLQNEWAEIVRNHEKEQKLMRLINKEKR